MKIRVSATSANLGPGFDCLGLALGLFNEVLIKPSKAFDISIKGFGEKSANLAKNNLFIQIFKEICQKHGQERLDFSFHFNNQIPFSRGLGSSSSIIIAALVAVHEILGLKIEKKELLNLALRYENHPDNIAPAVYGGFVCSILHKNEVYSIKKDIDTNLKALLVIPSVKISTEQSRLALKKNIAFQDCVYNISHSSLLTACFLEKKYDLLKIASKDRLHQFYRMKNLPELFEVQKFALENNALMSTLSGSGSSFFNLVYEEDGLNLRQKMQDKFKNFQIELLEFNNKGFEIC
ncbi:homoserine kinase [Campylobacter sp. MIT 99-7217]|uniref:homoserine kinase n=1 Tax=Campylobacter sp. MIT 99-7217 TaxID=535091 RepID=UPI00115B280D|nr:homoserine kinase [Campylobacter sp. MIT 99-7217]TQR31286.1 homoserine kinase [Campylobacter sp. MIT 99-7217]